MLTWAVWLTNFVFGYILLGLLFSIAFVAKGAAVVNPAVRQSSIAFRLILMPGTVLLWPLLGKLWWGTALRREVK